METQLEGTIGEAFFTCEQINDLRQDLSKFHASLLHLCQLDFIRYFSGWEDECQLIIAGWPYVSVLGAGLQDLLRGPGLVFHHDEYDG